MGSHNARLMGWKGICLTPKQEEVLLGLWITKQNRRQNSLEYFPIDLA